MLLNTCFKKPNLAGGLRNHNNVEKTIGCYSKHMKFEQGATLAGLPISGTWTFRQSLRLPHPKAARFSDSQPLKLSDSVLLRISDCQIVRFSNSQTLKPSDESDPDGTQQCRTLRLRPSDPQTLRLADSPSLRLSGPQTLRL